MEIMGVSMATHNWLLKRGFREKVSWEYFLHQIDCLKSGCVSEVFKKGSSFFYFLQTEHFE